MKYDFVGAIEQMTVHGRVMRIEGTNTDAFYTDTYAYFANSSYILSNLFADTINIYFKPIF